MSFEARSFDLSGVKGISQSALDLHLGLYRGYVKEVNALLEVLQPDGAASAPTTPQATQKLTREAAVHRFPFEHNGVVLHELFFEQLAGAKGDRLERHAPLAQALGQPFGGLDNWRQDFEQLATTRGIGWVVTVREQSGGAIYNTWVDEHQWGNTAGTEVIFLLDLWEHAYLLDFAPTERAKYVEVVFANVDWGVVADRLG
jgi:Fe-Mn family superoxide dismutase